MAIPVRIEVRVAFSDGSTHEYEVHSPQADQLAGLIPPLGVSPDVMRQPGEEAGLAAWLREQAEEDLREHRALVRAYAPNAAREGEVLLFRAQERVADCEAKLAALDLCERVIREDDRKHDACGAADSWTGLAVARLIVRMLASGYRHRNGYRQEWKP